MLRPLIFILSVVIIPIVGITAHADMVILRSGEMFQTSKAWRQDGSVYFYRNGAVVQYPERDVERVVESKTPPMEKTAPPKRPTLPTPAPHSSSLPPIQGGDTGYLGLKWGQSPSQTKGLTQAGTDPAYGGIQFYTIKKNTKRFGRASVDTIFLGFWRDGLYTILAEVSNYLDFTDLKSEAFHRYGPGGKNGSDRERYRWSDSVSDKLLVYDDDTGTGYLWMRSHALHEKVRIHYPD